MNSGGKKTPLLFEGGVAAQLTGWLIHLFAESEYTLTTPPFGNPSFKKEGNFFYYNFEAFTLVAPIPMRCNNNFGAHVLAARYVGGPTLGGRPIGS